ncbi:amidohydrolase/deacetylase family metallohydrolase [Daejeonella sp.]|uniref:amidohydrolase/deacetylase family metallohydrolase n=1 Tax=Daejeonella sp. TaxID=2805397 RepID=UPI00272F55F4|nr:amidohydrolase/deacetylase family metallohydrolase [Daejeonella sp.]MDP2413507.1 amidohydrolase/deacetylase family metallohydrolase [Daejeonella sp.]
MKKVFLLFFYVLMLTGFVHAQTRYDILIRGGHVIDKKNKINELMDVAIQNGKIAAIAKNINPGLAIQVVDAKGMYVSPGFIDLHTHVFAGTEVNRALSNGDTAVAPDGFTFRSGVTTVVDCGDAGWKSFPTFKRNIIDKSKTRVLSFLNIVGEGMRGRADYEQDINDMDAKMAANTALEYKDYIVGFKLAHFNTFSWVPVQRVVEAGKLADMPVIIDLGYRLPLEELFFKYLRPGDIYTHVFTEAARREPVTDIKTKQLRPFIIPAQKRGILFDVGFGGASFNFNQAIIAIKSGFLPNTISTDLHTGSMNAGMKDQVNVLSTLLAIGMDIPSVIARSTWAPAQAIKREELGNLSVGAIADVTVLSIRTGKFGFRDADGNRIEGKQRLECEMTIKGGKVVYELNSITANNP